MEVLLQIQILFFLNIISKQKNKVKSLSPRLYFKQDQLLLKQRMTIKC